MLMRCAVRIRIRIVTGSRYQVHRLGTALHLQKVLLNNLLEYLAVRPGDLRRRFGTHIQRPIRIAMV